MVTHYLSPCYICSFCINVAVADCGSPPVVENAGQRESGRRNPGGGASLGTTVMYTCITGYVISGESTRTCQADSTWSGSPPTCERRFPILLHEYVLQ